MHRLVTGTLLALGLTATAEADVVELHANAGFVGDIAGIAVSPPAGGSARWSALDLGGDEASGSLVLEGPPGDYVLALCLRPDLALPFGRWMFDFGLRTQGSAPAQVVADNIFAFGGDDPVHEGPCDGPWTAYLRFTGQSAVAAPAQFGSSIATYPFPRLQAILTVRKADAGPLHVDDWSVRVDTDVIFRDVESSAQVVTL